MIKLTNNYQGISFLSNSYKILSCTLLSELTPYVDEVIVDIEVMVLCIRQILKKKGEEKGH
jgi:hypothetical protein